tara:strand:+ start:198 stop:884 length:687 start_codon:yes stop_codon:yes gene_type:complete
MSNYKKVIIAGSEGLLGREISNSLSNEYDIVCLDLKKGNDFTNKKHLVEIFSKNKGAYGLVNLFAINPQPTRQSKSPEDISLDSLRNFMEVNVIALYSICIEFSKVCCDKASIINFGSTYGILSPKHFIYEKDFYKHPGYTISKSAVMGLSAYLSTYFAPRVRVNTIIPGGVENDQSEKFIKNYSKMTPMKRMMKKSEIVSPVKYLLSEESSYVTGSSINIDGGWSSW